MAAALDAFAWISLAFLWRSDPFSLYLGSCVLAAVAFAAMSPEAEGDSLFRLHLGASLTIVAVSTSDPRWSVPAILFCGILVRRGRERIVGYLVPSVVALGGLVLGDNELGLILLSSGLCLLWLVVSREVLRISPWGLVARTAASFLLLVGVSSALVRIAAWYPAEAPLGTMHALALGALTLGALGALAASRITTFLTALALARAGLVWLGLLGGASGRGPLLIELAASGVSLLLVASAVRGVDTLDDVATLASVQRRLVLTIGAFSACSLPPFPGFAALFPLASAVLAEGHASALLAAFALVFLAGLGCLRLVARAWDSGAPRTVDSTVGIAPVVLAIVSAWILGAAPARMIEAARAAALALF
jgi:hypothetical protein